MTSRHLLFCCFAIVPILVTASSLAQSGIAFDAPSSPSTAGSLDGDGTYLRLDASNDPVVGNLDVTGNFSATGTISNSVQNYINVGEDQIILNGGRASWTVTSGIAASSSSAKARLQQGQSGIISAELIGYADASGEVATYLGTSRTSAQGGDASGVILTAFALDVDGTPDVRAHVTAQGEIQAAGDSGSTGGFTLSGCSGCSIRETASEALTVASAGTGGDLYATATDILGLTAADIRVTGPVTFTGALIPTVTDVYALGSNTFRLSVVNAQTLNVNTLQDLDDANIGLADNLLPTSDAVFDLGTSGVQMGEVWTTELHSDAAAIVLGAGFNPDADDTYQLGYTGTTGLASVGTHEIQYGDRHVGTAPAALPTCDATIFLQIRWFDDTNDSKEGGPCACVLQADNVTFTWRSMTGGSCN